MIKFVGHKGARVNFRFPWIGCNKKIGKHIEKKEKVRNKDRKECIQVYWKLYVCNYMKY